MTTIDDLPPDDLQPGDMPDLAAPRYIDPRSLPARIHHLRAAGESGAHCLHAFQGDDTSTLARRLGSGAHALIAGKPVAVWRTPTKKGDKIAPRSGAAWTDFQREHAGAALLSVKEHDAARRMVDAILACAPAARLLAAPGLIVERSIIWSQLGRARQSTPDMRAPASAYGPSFNAEIKTTRSASPFFFALDAKKLTYHAQLADQAAAIAFETGSPPRASYIIAVESKRPHVVQVYEVPPSILEAGAALCTTWLERLQVYEASDMWGGYSPTIQTLEFYDRERLLADPTWMVQSTDTEAT